MFWTFLNSIKRILGIASVLLLALAHESIFHVIFWRSFHYFKIPFRRLIEENSLFNAYKMKCVQTIFTSSFRRMHSLLPRYAIDKISLEK